jgi:hypothetical protein
VTYSSRRGIFLLALIALPATRNCALVGVANTLINPMLCGLDEVLCRDYFHLRAHTLWNMVRVKIASLNLYKVLLSLFYFFRQFLKFYLGNPLCDHFRDGYLFPLDPDHITDLRYFLKSNK